MPLSRGEPTRLQNYKTIKTLSSILTLGTARQPLPPDVHAWLDEREATDPTADDAERLLAAWAITERLQRLEPGVRIEAREVAAPAAEDRALPSPRLNRGIQLIMGETYAALLPEALRLLEENNIQFPPYLLPDLLDRAVEKMDEDFSAAERMLAAAGARGRWLAGLNPAWRALAPDFDFAAAWRAEATPGKRLSLLKRWRKQDPTAAREALTGVWAKQSPKNQEVLLAGLTVHLSAEDLPWLRERLGPKRRGVRRAIWQLLLLGGEEQALNEATMLAAAALTAEGKIANLLTSDEAKELLTTYGGLQKKESLADFLLDVLPPNLLPDLLGQTGPEFWATLRKDELQLAGKTLLRYHLPEWDAAFVRFACIVNPAQLPIREAAALCTRLPQATFTTLFHELLDSEKALFHLGGAPRILALSRNEAWSERITKSFVLQLVHLLKDVYALPHATLRDLQAHWRLSVPLLHLSTFGWLRTQFHAMTERGDTFGRLATETLQTVAFRRKLVDVNL